MKKIIVAMGTLLVLSLSLVGCGSDASSNDSKKEKAKDTKTSQTKKEEKSNDKGVIERQKYNVTWSEDWKGLKTKIDQVSVVKMEESALKETGEKGQGIIGVKFYLENNGDKDFNTYPDQATILVDGQQIEATMLASDHIGGELLRGAKKEGVVSFVIPKMESAKNYKEIRLKWDSDYDTENYEEDSSHDHDITINLD